MTSQLNVDTIKGKTTEGSITIQGEGSATTNLQQGLNKAWVQHAAGTNSDSLNISGITDNATGNFTLSFSNNMNNALYSGTFGGASTGNFACAYNDGQYTASGFNMSTFNYNGASLADPDHATAQVVGDLA